MRCPAVHVLPPPQAPSCALVSSLDGPEPSGYAPGAVEPGGNRPPSQRRPGCRAEHLRTQPLHPFPLLSLSSLWPLAARGCYFSEFWKVSAQLCPWSASISSSWRPGIPVGPRGGHRGGQGTASWLVGAIWWHFPPNNACPRMLPAAAHTLGWGAVWLGQFQLGFGIGIPTGMGHPHLCQPASPPHWCVVLSKPLGSTGWGLGTRQPVLLAPAHSWQRPGALRPRPGSVVGRESQATPAGEPEPGFGWGRLPGP